MDKMNYAEASMTLFQLEKSLEILSVKKYGPNGEIMFKETDPNETVSRTMQLMSNSATRREMYYLSALRRFGILDAFRHYLEDAKEVRRRNTRFYFRIQLFKAAVFVLLGIVMLWILDPCGWSQLIGGLSIIVVMGIGSIIPATSLLIGESELDDGIYEDVINVDDNDTEQLEDEIFEEEQQEEDISIYIHNIILRQRYISSAPYFFKYPKVALECAIYFVNLLDNPLFSTIYYGSTCGYLKDPEYKLVENFVRQVYKLPTEITEINVENFETEQTDPNEPQEEEK